VQPLTGYERGAVTVIGARKPFPVHLDEIAELFEEIAVSAGAKGLQVVLRTADYMEMTGASIAGIGA
jgi:Cys-tRNA(Pro)/Cys-tRNA(Cys) deacylase